MKQGTQAAPTRRKRPRSRGYGRTADDCMDFYHAMTACHRYMIRTEARAEGITVVQYLRREIPALIEEGKRGSVAAA